jgi:hypothetical protein
MITMFASTINFSSAQLTQASSSSAQPQAQ